MIQWHINTGKDEENKPIWKPLNDIESTMLEKYFLKYLEGDESHTYVEISDGWAIDLKTMTAISVMDIRVKKSIN